MTCFLSEVLPVCSTPASKTSFLKKALKDKGLALQSSESFSTACVNTETKSERGPSKSSWEADGEIKLRRTEIEAQDAELDSTNSQSIWKPSDNIFVAKCFLWSGSSTTAITCHSMAASLGKWDTTTTVSIPHSVATSLYVSESST